MLSQADQFLVERDRHIPGLATLLDEEAMLSLLQARGQAVDAVTSTYVRYKPHTNCLVGYKVMSNQQCHWFYGKVFAIGQTKKLARYELLNSRDLGVGLRPLMIEDLGMAIAPFPLDISLTAMIELLDTTTQSQVCQQLIFSNSPITEVSITTLNYKPERRYVGKVSLKQLESQSWAIKAYTWPDYVTARKNSQDFQSREVLQIAPQVGSSHCYQMLAFPWIKDQPLPHLILESTSTTVQSYLKQVGIALGELHRQKSKRLQPVSCTAEALDLMKLTKDLYYLYPTLSPMIEGISRTISEHLGNLPQQWCSTHGDFKPDQVLMQHNRVTLLDLDRSALGHPARDLGSFLARLESQYLRGDLDDSRRQAATLGLINGYHILGNTLPPETIQIYTALHLFKLLPEPFRYRVKDWPRQMEQMLHRIQLILPPS